MISRFTATFCTAISLAYLGGAPLTAKAVEPTQMDPVVVTDHLDHARNDIVPELGASSFSMDEARIATLPQGEDTPFAQVLLQAPGVAEDSASNGDLHVRGEHGNLQYRINGILLPEGISGFGSELDPRFVSNLQLITGSLPAQYGFRTSGVIDITTKGEHSRPGEAVGLYEGSFNTLKPSFELSGGTQDWDWFADASAEHNALGIENPTPSRTAHHDDTNQEKAFAYASKLLDSSSRLSLMASASHSDFQVPTTPGLPNGTSANGSPWEPYPFDSAALNENQHEDNAYVVAAYQKTTGDCDYQLSTFARGSRVHFVPDWTGDLAFNGVASEVVRTLGSLGLEADASIPLGTACTLRLGGSLLEESVGSSTRSAVFPVNDAGNPTGGAELIADSQTLHGLFAGLYLQNEWRLSSALTVNAGFRLDQFDSSFDSEGQLSPRINAILQPNPSTSLHIGYSRYFTPPPVEAVNPSAVARFLGTSNAPDVTLDDPVRSERSDYFDLGISQHITPQLTVGLDAYEKRATNQLDDGLFGQTLILSAFNYAKGSIRGAELTGSYELGRLSTYVNAAENTGSGRRIDSAQFLFDRDTLDYISNHAIYLDHDQKLSASTGATYTVPLARGSLSFSADALFGTGLRTDAVMPDGTVVPNGGTVPSHLVVNLSLARTFNLSGSRKLSFRLEMTNLMDTSYELRDGTGVGVNAAQYGARRGIYGAEDLRF